MTTNDGGARPLGNSNDPRATGSLGEVGASASDRLSSRDPQARGLDYRLVARVGSAPTPVFVGDIEFGGTDLVLMAGPCAVESEEQIHDAARRMAAMGVRVLRGGAFKPRTSPYAFQGLGIDGYRLLREAADAHGMKVVSEVLSESHIEAAVEFVDLIQVGSRNMHNFALLKELARCGRPVLLKRGMSATCDELLSAAEYLVSGGNDQVILCERGIRTFETATRNTLDISAVPVLKRKSHLPVVIDPSHAAGRADIVAELAYAAVAVGADGLLIESHPKPATAKSDADQALRPDELATALPTMAAVARAIGRRLPCPAGDRTGEVAELATDPR